MSISVQHLTKYYGKQKALNDVCFSLEKGEICGFLGPNGAGKSTTMKIITGCLNRYEGGVSVCGIDIRQHPLRAKDKIGYLPEHNPLYPDMYIKEYLSYVARLYHMECPGKQVQHVIELTGLIPERKKKIGQLSKGYRQRVGLAQALVHNPEVLILDEPMTGLDPNQLEEIRNLIIRIGKDKTVMLSTHVMQEVEAICNRVIIINNGDIIKNESKQALHTLSRAMLLEVTFAGEQDMGWLQELPGLQSVIPSGSNHYQLIAPADQDPRIALFNEAATRQCPIIELKVNDTKLEDIFKQLTQDKTEASDSL